MTDYIWISLAPQSGSLGRRMGADPVPGDATYPHGYLARNEAGEPLGPECFPKVMWTVAERDHETLPDFFQGINGFVLSGPCAEALRRFDLGGGALYPVQLLKRDRVTPIAGDYSSVLIAAARPLWAKRAESCGRTVRRARVFNDDVWRCE